jgi:hypothetical protein
MADYRTLLRHAGLPDDEVERIATAAEADDESNMNEDQDTSYLEKHIKLILSKTGLDLWNSHSLMIDGSTAEVTIAADAYGIPLSQILDFANQIAAAGLGSDVKISGANGGALTLNFNLVS